MKKDEAKIKEPLMNEQAALATEFIERQEAWQESQIHLAGILAITNEAIIAIDETQRITLFNTGAEKIFGYSPAEALGQPLDLLLPDRFVLPHQEHVVDFANAAATARLMSERQEIVGRRKNGEEFPAEASISKLDLDGRRVFTVVLHDITKRKRAEVEREKLIEELDAFAHTVANDLLDPLSLIIGYANLLKEEARLPEAWQNYLNAIARNGHKLNNIIDELQLLAGVRKVDVELKPLPMARIVAEAQQRLAYMIEEYQAKLIIAESWPVVLGHAPWVEAVWTNYLSNGIKFGGRPPRLHLGVTARSDGIVRFWVRDNGPGLTPEAQADLFKPFTQLDQVQTKGHGLGLSIVRRIVEKLGGQVGVESEGVPGRGSAFSFTLKQA